jgi:hypothetical protein
MFNGRRHANQQAEATSLCAWYLHTVYSSLANHNSIFIDICNQIVVIKDLETIDAAVRFSSPATFWQSSHPDFGFPNAATGLFDRHTAELTEAR